MNEIKQPEIHINDLVAGINAQLTPDPDDVTEYLLTPFETRPANWHITEDGDDIIATCGNLIFKGTPKEFSSMLVSGVVVGHK